MGLKVEFTKTTEREASRKWRASNPQKVNAARTEARANRTVKFTCVDGEGQTGKCRECDCPRYEPGDTLGSRETCAACGHYRNAAQGNPGTGHEHVYVLLGVGDKQIANPDGLGWEAIVEFLYSCYEEYTVYAGFFLGYDFANWFKSIPWDDYDGKRVPKPVQLLTQDGIRDRAYTTDAGTTVYHPVKLTGKRLAGEVAKSVPVVRNAIGRGDLDIDTRMVWEIHLHADRRLMIRPKVCCKDAADTHVNKVNRPLAYDPASIPPDDQRCPVWHTVINSDVTGKRCVRKVHKGDHVFEDDRVSCPDAPAMYINDAGGYFQMSFLSLIEPTARKWGSSPVVSQSEYELIERGKSDRNAAVLGPDMERYNRLENEVLSRVLTVYESGFRELGITLDKKSWYGPGQLAQIWLKQTLGKEHGQRVLSVTPAEAMNAARQSYFGGWFEIMVHGIVPGITWEYDINSAYPHIISTLPCLLHGEWTSRKPAKPLKKLPAISPGQLRLVSASVWGSNPYIGAMTHRALDMTILRPHSTRGWFWQHELEAAVRAGLIDRAEVYEYHTLTSHAHECQYPLAGVKDLYQKRLEKGKSTPIGKGIKLVINSIYGKFAQSIGNPPYANPVYASLITAGCRTMILDAVATHPNGARDVLMVATDGVYFRTPHPGLPLSDQLGDWEGCPGLDCPGCNGNSKHHGRKQNICLFKPGVYWDDKARDAIAEGQAPQFKSRGVSARELAGKVADIDTQFASWHGAMPIDKRAWPKATFPLTFAMTSAKQAVRGKWQDAGLVSDIEVTHSAWPGDKRSVTDCTVIDGIYHSKPHDLDSNKDGLPQYSRPYNKTMGVQAMYENGQLDLEQYGLTDSGLISDRWYDAFREAD